MALNYYQEDDPTSLVGSVAANGAQDRAIYSKITPLGGRTVERATITLNQAQLNVLFSYAGAANAAYQLVPAIPNAVIVVRGLHAFVHGTPARAATNFGTNWTGSLAQVNAANSQLLATAGTVSVGYGILGTSSAANVITNAVLSLPAGFALTNIVDYAYASGNNVSSGVTQINRGLFVARGTADFTNSNANTQMSFTVEYEVHPLA